MTRNRPRSKLPRQSSVRPWGQCALGVSRIIVDPLLLGQASNLSTRTFDFYLPTLTPSPLKSSSSVVVLVLVLGLYLLKKPSDDDETSSSNVAPPGGMKNSLENPPYQRGKEGDDSAGTRQRS